MSNENNEIIEDEVIDETENPNKDISIDATDKDVDIIETENIEPKIIVEDFEINIAMNMNYIIKINNIMVENLICNFNGNNVVYQTNVMNNTVFMENLDYCRAVEQKFKEKINDLAEKLNYVQRLA